MFTLDDRGSFAKVSKSMKRQADRLQSDLASSATKSAEQIRSNLKKSAASILPQRGGLAKSVADMSFRIDKKSNGARLEANSRYNIKRLDEGTVTHPVYGHRVSVTQSITPGFWSKTIADSGKVLAADAERCLNETVHRIEKG